jgi:hypothetical protein
MPEHRKSKNYQLIKCSECPNTILRKTGVTHPVCVDCKARKAAENWKKRRMTYAHSKKQNARYTESKSNTAHSPLA